MAALGGGGAARPWRPSQQARSRSQRVPKSVPADVPEDQRAAFPRLDADAGWTLCIAQLLSDRACSREVGVPSSIHIVEVHHGSHCASVATQHITRHSGGARQAAHLSALDCLTGCRNVRNIPATPYSAPPAEARQRRTKPAEHRSARRRWRPAAFALRSRRASRKRSLDEGDNGWARLRTRKSAVAVSSAAFGWREPVADGGSVLYRRR